jgi:hypothetical protein
MKALGMNAQIHSRPLIQGPSCTRSTATRPGTCRPSAACRTAGSCGDWARTPPRSPRRIRSTP